MSNDTLHPLSRALANTPQGPMRSPARALAWFGIGLGVAELLLPRGFAKAVGAPNLPLLTRLCGLREIGVGVGLLNSVDPEPWLWGRVAGDVFDLASVGIGLVTAGRPTRSVASLLMLSGIAYVDLKTAQGAPPKPGARGDSLHDYSMRSGFPKPAAEMRGAALPPAAAEAAPRRASPAGNGRGGKGNEKRQP